MRNVGPELVALPGGLAPPDRPQPPPAVPRRQVLATPLPAAGTPPTPQTQGGSRNQGEEQNPHPAPQMHIGLGFRIQTAIDKAASNRVYILLTDYGHHYCLLCHLKGVGNTHYGGRHSHRPLSQSKCGRLVKWPDRF